MAREGRTRAQTRALNQEATVGLIGTVGPDEGGNIVDELLGSNVIMDTKWLHKRKGDSKWYGRERAKAHIVATGVQSIEGSTLLRDFRPYGICCV